MNEQAARGTLAFLFLAETLYSGSPELSCAAWKKKVLQPILISFTFDLCVAYEATKADGDP